MQRGTVDIFVSDSALKKICTFLDRRQGMGTSAFKESYIKRRIFFRAKALKIQSAEAYFRYLATSDSEQLMFRNALTVNVSAFFRNPDVYNTLAKSVFPDIIGRAAAKGGGKLKILSIGCATGEEPYSVAMLLKEHFPDQLRRFKPQILGVDYDRESIETARTGIYDRIKLSVLDGILKKKYFAIIDSTKYQLVSEIREMVVFKHDDIFSVDLRGSWDLVMCRNMLIYINAESQERLLEKVAYACRAGSYLVLGKSEGLSGRMRHSFASLYPKERIYIKRSAYANQP